jgi:hypothetical protein
MDRADVMIEPEQKRDISKIVNYLNENSTSRDTLLTLFYLPMFNFISNRNNPYFYDIFFPHNLGSEKNQQRMVGEIKKHMITYIIIKKDVLTPADPDGPGSRFRFYGHQIVQYVEKNYHIVTNSGPFLLLKLNTL